MRDRIVRVFTVSSEEAGMRLDVFCASRLEGLSRTQVQRLNRGGSIRVNSGEKRDHYLLKRGERVEIRYTTGEGQEERPVPQNIPIRIVYEDEDLLVVNKDAGLVVHPAHGHQGGTLVNAVLGMGKMLSSRGGAIRPGIVHRLDKETSGLIVVAKTDAAYESLSGQIRDKEMKKEYRAIVWGNLGVRSRTIEYRIGRHPVRRQKMAVMDEGGREALTKVFVLDSFEHFEYIRIITVTGRTHQIRVHLSHVSHPILGDPVYGGRRRKGVARSTMERATLEKLLKIMKRQALHASVLSFSHPVTKRSMRFRTAIPEDMRLALETLYREDQAQGG